MKVARNVLASLMMTLTILACQIAHAGDQLQIDIPEPMNEFFNDVCDSNEPVLYKSKITNDEYLLACECNCTSHENEGWFISTSEQSAQKITLGKSAIASNMKADYVPDIMHSHPMCHLIEGTAINKDLAKKASFITLIKYPTNNDEEPYCFEPRYILNEEDFNIIESGRELNDDEDVKFDEDPDTLNQIISRVRKIKDSND